MSKTGLTLACLSIRSQCVSVSAFTHTTIFCIHEPLLTAMFPTRTVVCLCKRVIIYSLLLNFKPS